MEAAEYESLNINILCEKESVIVSSEHALRDVIPVKWDDAVVSGRKRALLVCA